MSDYSRYYESQRDDSFDESSGEYDYMWEDDVVPVLPNDDSVSLDTDSEEEKRDMKRPRENDEMDVDYPNKKQKTNNVNNFNAMTMYAKVHDQEQKNNYWSTIIISQQ